MKHIFITYGDHGYEAAKLRLVQEAKLTGQFDEVYSFGRSDLSDELLKSDVIKEKRGGGLWSWKPDIILTTINNSNDGDIIVYCDAGCSVYRSREWNRYWGLLKNHDMIAQRIFQRTDCWTRKELLDLFTSNGRNLAKRYQYQATPIFKVSNFSKQFVSEWRDLMINNPKLAMDVSPEERVFQHPSFIENRHDQAIYSVLVYKYLSDPFTKGNIYTQWEHIEDFDPFFKQAIRATRLRDGQLETTNHILSGIIKRIIKDYVFKPFYYAPLQWWYSL